MPSRDDLQPQHDVERHAESLSDGGPQWVAITRERDRSPLVRMIRDRPVEESRRAGSRLRPCLSRDAGRRPVAVETTPRWTVSQPLRRSRAFLQPANGIGLERILA
jgi:hypothetical protein